MDEASDIDRISEQLFEAVVGREGFGLSAGVGAVDEEGFRRVLHLIEDLRLASRNNAMLPRKPLSVLFDLPYALGNASRREPEENNPTADRLAQMADAVRDAINGLLSEPPVRSPP